MLTKRGVKRAGEATGEGIERGVDATKRGVKRAERGSDREELSEAWMPRTGSEAGRRSDRRRN